MKIEITNPIEIQEGDDEEIPLIGDDVKHDIIDTKIVDANLDNNDENDENVVSEGDEDEFSDRESDIDSFDRDLEEYKSDDGGKEEPSKHFGMIIPSLMHPQDSCPDPNHDDAQDPTQQIEEVHAYVQLWERTKRRKDGSWDPDAAVKYEEYKELHMS
ncbi:hypothetical protein Cgig2_020290 [Carnegiea gigantea]|uniref:Uncharacterized protein n=1 Tax=Carnegiea gigantea TaxID=171969 RepID=A0A9Q1GUU1_9CARY|nr:hypothetical protein Cgig2_020290 [Carnegiea gigantea]